MQSNCWLFSVWVLPIITIAECSWGEPGSSQYHIQTDEGPERYFRFQTDNGQFRKEKRLRDGTVIGTEAWIDAAGFLRQKDYIADHKGYRILKSKTIFVGENRRIEDAIKSTKSVPAQSGILVKSSRANSNNQAARLTTPAPLPAGGSTVQVYGDEPPSKFSTISQAAQIQPSPNLGFDHYPDEIENLQSHSAPETTHSGSLYDNYDNSISDNYYHRQKDGATAHQKVPLTPAPPLLTISPPFESKYRRVRPIAISPTVRTPIVVSDVALAHNGLFQQFSTPAPFAVGGTSDAIPTQRYLYSPPVSVANGGDKTQQRAYYAAEALSPTVASPLNVNSLEGLLPPLPPTYRRSRPQVLQKNVVDGVEEYDGVSSTAKGFRYFLPRHYHEEENIDDQKRAGSFGYVDPFGIRRVVYYNTSPERGFVHRNKNRYVGLGGLPYDATQTN